MKTVPDPAECSTLIQEGSSTRSIDVMITAPADAPKWKKKAFWGDDLETSYGQQRGVVPDAVDVQLK